MIIYENSSKVDTKERKLQKMETEIKKIQPNKKQQECIDNIDGTVMVLAGPGTGKTFTLIQRLRAMIQEKGISPSNIICMTFSDAAASEMKERLISQAGKSATGVEINTYHAFCNNLIRQYPSKFELMENVNLIDDISKVTLMKQCIDEFKPTVLVDKWNNPYFYLKQLLISVDEIKKNRISKEQFFSNMKSHPEWDQKLEELEAEKTDREENNKALKSFLSQKYDPQIKKIEKAKEAIEIIELYSKTMAQKNFIDFNDMINLVVETFENDEDFLKKVAKDYKYILIDEYQDTNLLQNRLIDLLAKGAETENIFVVGDDDQIIYGFQGARSDNLENFLHKYPDTKVICLNENNRSTQSILDLSYKIIAQDDTRLEINPEFKHHNISKILTSKNEKIIKLDKKSKLIAYADKLQENNTIIKSIEKLIADDTFTKNEKGEKDLSQIAILTRENKQLMPFSSLLEAKNIPYQIRITKSIFQIKPTILIYFYLKALNNHILASDKLFALLASKPFDFEIEDYNFLLEQNKPLKKDFIALIKENIDKEWKNTDKIKSFMETFEKIKTLSFHKPLKYLILEIANRTGILAYFANSPIDLSENLLAIKRLTAEAESFANLNPTAGLSDFIKHLDTALNENIEINIEKDSHIKNAIQLSTIHSSKGREFEYVFMPNLITTEWEKKRNTNKLDLPLKAKAEEDEELIKRAEQLKLLFVGITRAKHTLEMSYANTIEQKTYSLTSYLSELQNIEGIVSLETHNSEDLDFFKELAESMTKEEFNHHFAFEKELKERLENFTLSAHSFNLYRNCPRQFLYSELYQIPIIEKDSQYLNFGNSIHKTLEWAVNSALEKGRYPHKEGLIDVFNKKLETYKFETEEKYIEYIERGKKCIENYYHHLISTPIKNIYEVESRFDGVKIENNLIKGFIDRIEKNEDGSFSLFDYKTGSAKSKNDIAEGKKYENYYNQLRFYKLAFETKNQGSTVSKVGLIFAEEPEKNIELEITEAENQDIKQKIQETLENIKSMKFDPVDYKKQKEKNCEYCDYKMICRLNVL